MKKDIKSLNLEQLTEELLAIGEKKFRAKQIYSWIHEKLVDSFEEMTNLSKGLRENLNQNYTLQSLEVVEVQTSKLDGTQKYLFRLHDGHVIESVLMKYHHGNSVCISSQVGCRMGCKFCASTIGGKVRDLAASEMLGQIYKIQKISGERVHNVVVMGTGEPLDNYENLVQFVKMLTDENGLHISQRNLTVSTCGIVPKMKELAGEKFQMTLALSLHATSQEKRKELMPIAYKYELKEVLDACCYYYEQTGRRITFEYSLVGGVNDTKQDAESLTKLIGKFPCHVNLIPVNPIKERNFVQPDRSECEAFRNKLEKNGINVTIRREMGRDIDGACGQLRKSYLDKEKGEIE